MSPYFKLDAAYKTSFIYIEYKEKNMRRTTPHNILDTVSERNDQGNVIKTNIKLLGKLFNRR